MDAHSQVVSPISEQLRTHLGTLEAIFSDPGLAELRAASPIHPAVIQYDEIGVYLANGVYYPDDIEAARSVSISLLDQTVWIAPIEADYWAIIPDRAAREKVKQRIRKPSQFHDTMAEVFYWAWLRSAGIEAHLIEVEGHPDIKAMFYPELESWIEIKRIRLGTSVTRIRKDIKKASSQLAIGNDERAGVVVISLDRAVERLSLDEAIPSDVEKYLAEARRELGSGHSTHVAKVVFVWDELAADVAVGEMLTYRLHRRSVVLDHSAPICDLSIDHEALLVDRAISLSAPWPGKLNPAHRRRSSIQHEDLIVGPQFWDFNAATDGIRPQHAIEAILSPDAEYRHQLTGGNWQSFVTRRVSRGREPYTMLILARELGDGRREIGEAYRIYGDDQSLSRDPLKAFYVLVQRYGAPVGLRLEADAEPTWCLLAMSAVVPMVASSNGRSVDMAIPADGRNYLLRATSIALKEGLQEAVVELLYLVDVQRYRQAVARRGG